MSTPATEWERGGGFKGVGFGGNQGYSFDIPDYTEEIISLKEGKDRAEIILNLIEKHKPHRSRMLMNYQRYKTDAQGVPIYHRKFEREVTTDNRINNDYFSEIVNTKTGYFAGKPATYSYDKAQPEFESANELLTDFLERNRISDINMETTKYCAIAGYSARLLYLEPVEGRERIKYLPGHQVILLNEDGDIVETEYAVRYYGEEGRYIIHFYDAEMRYKYKQTDGKLELIEEAIHGFKLCPLIGYANNDELMGDADKVLNNIDAYDRAISDVNSEIEAFRLAYLLIIGANVSQDAIDGMKKTGALNLKAMGAGGNSVDARFLEKDLNDTAVENHLDRLHDAIYRFSATPDLSDEAFGGTQSGEAMKFKLFGLDTKCSSFEMKFKASDTRMFQVIATKWKIENKVIDPFKVFSDFKRNFPRNMINEADVLMKLKGSVSEATRLGTATFIEDTQYEIEQMKKEDMEQLEILLAQQNAENKNANTPDDQGNE